VNPLQIVQDRNGDLTIKPEAMIIYAEGTPCFDYVKDLIGEWEGYTSKTVKLPNAVAHVQVQVDEEHATSMDSRCSAYIYGYMPGDPEWEEGSCVAVVFFDSPSLKCAPTPNYTVIVCFECEVSKLDVKTTIPIYEEEPSEPQDN
jgi:hypothetical protein